MVGAWRAQVSVRIAELRHRLDSVAALGPPAPAGSQERAVWEAHALAVREAVARAERALALASWPQRIRRWGGGTDVTIAWESVHEAEGHLVEVESEAAVKASLPRLRAWMREVISDRTLLEYYGKLDEYVAGTAPLDRVVVRQAYQDTLVANNDKYANVRRFRNILAAAALALGLGLLGVALWHVVNPDFVSLCGEDPAGGDTLCVGGDEPSRVGVFEVLAVGLVGGLLSAAFALGKLRQPPSRYSVRELQMLLKPVAGAGTGLLGVLLVQGNLLISPAERTEAALIAYAAAFGFAQQLLTRFVDNQASRLLGEPDEKREDEKA
jgi:hypothetical protein